MLHTVKRPAGRAVADCQDAVAGKGTVRHQLCSGIVIVRLFQRNFYIFYKAPDNGFAHAVGKGGMHAAEILLHHMIDGIGGTCCRLLFRYGEGVSRV